MSKMLVAKLSNRTVNLTVSLCQPWNVRKTERRTPSTAEAAHVRHDRKAEKRPYKLVSLNGVFGHFLALSNGPHVTNNMLKRRLNLSKSGVQQQPSFQGWLQGMLELDCCWLPAP
ncbi:MAG: hypothetical protein H6934_03455 [Burkholderiaceae bacterium]|nr:hypothetical protein [Burkholderiaceae bacterium]